QKDLADSLVALHESGSLSLGADWRVTRPFSVHGDISRLQDRAGLTEGRSMRVGLRHTGLPLGISGGLTGHLYHNSVSDSRQFQADLVRSFARSTRVSLRAGQQTLDNGGQSQSRNWVGMALDQELWRGAYIRGEGEQERGDGASQLRLSAELGWRF
ncbi:MAG: hypothetical protein KC488_16200, partial [Candidatus Cloacimonetes bacterium]|nr:hypothetical protein [Candidatus Cloacimonadota bacterium]